jgi:hypothetical protein
MLDPAGASEDELHVIFDTQANSTNGSINIDTAVKRVAIRNSGQ